MILIADAGSTKIHWAVTDANHQSRVFATLGLNAVTASSTEIDAVLEEVRGWLGDAVPSKIFYYGAGCASPAICDNLRRLIASGFPEACIEVHSDLLGAARALFADRDGIVAILGTGSNSGLYRNRQIIANVPPLGFILGDEGSGAVIGKRIVADVARGIASPAVAEIVSLSKEEIIENVYRKLAPNRFLAGVVRKLVDVKEDEYLDKIFNEALESFFARNIAIYGCPENAEIGFVGSLAYLLRDRLAVVADNFGFKLGPVIQSPIENLISYHENS